MCGRYSLSAPTSQIIEEFELDEELNTFSEELQPRYNIAPSQKIPVIRQESDSGKRILQFMKWQFIPSWTQDIKKLPFMINARAETISSKPSFRGAFSKKRCIIPASSFYEWKKVNGKKEPYLIKKKDNSLMGFAALWESWKDAQSRIIETAVIITSSASPALADIHDRMPVILEKEFYSIWLDCSPGGGKDAFHKEQVESFLKPFSQSELEFYAISPRINSAKVDDPSLVERIKKI